MDVSECVVSAGRAVLDMVEREWQPLSAEELEQRLDQAVEETLEADLISELRSRMNTTRSPAPPLTPPTPQTLYVQLLQPQAGVASTVFTAAPGASNLEEEEEEEEEEQLETVKFITNLLQSSKSRVRMAGRARLSLSHTVQLSLTLLSERISYRCVSRRFHLEKGNIHRIFFSFCEHINTLEEQEIRWPVGDEAVESMFPLFHPENQQEDEDKRSVPQVLGVLGLTRIPIRLPIGKHDVESAVPEVKRMKKEAHPDSWLNLELVCDINGRFLHCSISRGSDDVRGAAVRDKLKLNPDLMPPGSCIVAGAGYPVTAHILTPYSSAHGPREELFNKTLEEHLHIFDQAVADLRATFQRLKYLDIVNYDRARAVVLTACVLHNVFLNLRQTVRGEVEKDETATGNGDGETEDEGVRRRDAVADLLFKNFESGNIKTSKPSEDVYTQTNTTHLFETDRK